MLFGVYQKWNQHSFGVKILKTDKTKVQVVEPK